MVATSTRGTLAAHDAVSLSSLVARHGTPLYLYDLGSLRSRIAELRSALAPAEASLYFATMANDRPKLLQVIAAEGVGACVNSMPHLRMALDAAFPIKDMQHTSTGITREDMAALVALGVRVNLDSLGQLRAWLAQGGAAPGIRVNAASLTGQSGGDRIGIGVRQLHEAVALAHAMGSQIAGVHVYVGTNFRRHEDMLPTLEAFFQAAARIPELAYVNIGGGIGVNYARTGPEFDDSGYGLSIATYAALLRDSLGRSVEVIVEPGRAMTARAAAAWRFRDTPST